MSTLTTIRAAVRQDLHDEVAGSYRWTDAVLDRHIARAVQDYSLAAPLEQVTTLATTAGSRDLSLASLAGLIKVYAAEWRLGQFPPAYQRFAVWQATLTFLGEEVPDGTNCKVYWGCAHTLDESTSTIPTAHEAVIATGAAGFAALEQAIYNTDRLNVGGDADLDFQRLGQLWLVEFRRQLRGLGAKLRTARLYSPYALTVSKATDYGP